MKMDLLILVSLGLQLLFAFLWRWACRIRNFSLVDAAWAYSIGLSALVFGFFGGGELSKRVVATVLILTWSLRLGSHLAGRIRRMHPEEDSRYAKLRAQWSGRVERNFFWFFLGQAVSVLLLALPFFFIARDESPWSAWETVGLLVALLGIGGEALADWQMTQFKKKNSDSKAVCRDGLWHYSRHPNYFFEAVIWIGFYLLACGSAGGWAMVYAPAIIIFLLLKVTGIPATEASAVKRKGEAYREYQRSTSAFIPLPPNK